MAKDAEIFYIEDDLKKIQTKSNLYIQKYGPPGVFHLFKECAQNDIDEYDDPDCIKFLREQNEGRKKRVIKVTHERQSDRVTIEDNGRGISEEQYPIDIVCTKLQSGSKFFRNQGGNSSGEFGVGLTVVNALSSEFSIATYRNDYFHEIKFKDAVKVSDVKGKLKKGGKKHGTILSFIANKTYLGPTACLPMEDCIEWMELMSYQVDEGIEFLVEEYDGMALVKSTKIKKKPFSDMIYKFLIDEKRISFGPEAFHGKGSIVEDITSSQLQKDGTIKQKKERLKKQISLEFAFAYDAESLDNNYVSFCNFTKTDEGGVHLESVEESLCRFLQKAAKDSLTENQKAKWDITRGDVKSGLQLVVNLSTNAQVQFMGNAKNQIQNEELRPILKEIVSKVVSEYFEKDTSKLSTISKIIVQNARMRIEMQKAKITGITKRVDTFKDMENTNFVKANNPGNHGELFLVEGKKSALGSMVNGRDANFQAIFGFRGVTLNPYKCNSIAEVMANAEWKSYINVIKTGVGSTFNIDRLAYDKLIISADADVDGAGISVGIAGFHVKVVPKIVETGHLYRVYPPLYHIADSKTPFVRNKGELSDIYLKKIAKNYRIRPVRNPIYDGYMKKDDFWGFLYDTIDYQDILGYARDYYKVDKRLIEVTAGLIVQFDGLYYENNRWCIKENILENQKFITRFMQEIQRKFPEINLKGNRLVGVAFGKEYEIRLNNVFVRKIEELIPVYQSYGCYLGVKEKECEEREMTIGEFLDSTVRLIPQILARYKGLGEADADQLWETTMNPETRILVQLTFDDIERDMELFMKLKSDKLAYRAERKKMMESFKINRTDLDT